MFDDLPPDLERLLTLWVWHAMWPARIDNKIADVQRREAEREHGERVRPARPEWIVQLGIGTGRPPVQVHADAAGNRRRAVNRDVARHLLASGLPACPHCQPDMDLRLLD
ncbi:DUF6233 domain-containing protein [Streptomyces hawaiiensis]|uniref:DUF6233 domain-containing protein n=1 Tax=Streptomyces hawaiiensis TaxID=67305 RepID=UPI0031D01C76